MCKFDAKLWNSSTLKTKETVEMIVMCVAIRTKTHNHMTVPFSARRSSELLLKSIDSKNSSVYLFWAEVLSFILPSTIIECANFKSK